MIHLINIKFFKKIFLFITLLVVMYHGSPLYAAMCPPCMCVESTSGNMESTYVETQLSILDGYIQPDIQGAIDKAKEALELAKKSYQNIVNIEEVTSLALQNEEEIVALLEKLYRQKILEVDAKKALLKAKITSNEITILKDNK